MPLKKIFAAWIFGLVMCGLLVAPARANLSPAQLESGRNKIELSPHLSYTIDPENRADYVTMFAQAGQEQFRPLPNKKSTFGFSRGTYWFHARLFNKDSFDERWLLVLQYPLLDEINVYLRYPDGRTSVWIVQAQDDKAIVRERIVKTGIEFDEQVEIRSGLESGLRVVARGNEALRDGQPVAVR